ncbi:hypothetical protein VB620_00795 [Nodularia harveyana UHCC-0300]|uniref:Uncharacterized protein n=1 Tax=Nodularia harveyana UHCC-0300 TaxID=2974287 RepID=A0ABU5U8M5_9CYAN|nr:hypothetical protein [Nodularia harveyana]MEA5579875.1 hypothetical protein [Nodularia harveyana UHCC-0300]
MTRLVYPFGGVILVNVFGALRCGQFIRLVYPFGGVILVNVFGALRFCQFIRFFN